MNLKESFKKIIDWNNDVKSSDKWKKIQKRLRPVAVILVLIYIAYIASFFIKVRTKVEFTPEIAKRYLTVEATMQDGTWVAKVKPFIEGHNAIFENCIVDVTVLYEYKYTHNFYGYAKNITERKTHYKYAKNIKLDSNGNGFGAIEEPSSYETPMPSLKNSVDKASGIIEIAVTVHQLLKGY